MTVTPDLISVPGTDLYLYVSSRPRRGAMPAETEWAVTDAAGSPVAFGVSAYGPRPDDIGSSRAYEMEPTTSSVGHVSIGQRSSSRGGSAPARALAFALRLAAEWLDAEWEAAQPEVEAVYARHLRERAEMEAARARSRVINERVVARLQALREGQDGDLRVRLALASGREVTGYVQELAEDRGLWRLTLDGGRVVGIPQIERVEVRADSGRYVPAFTREELHEGVTA